MSSHQHHRQSSAFSSASAFRSTSPSPVSPTLSAGDEGLSRRHSWSRNEERTAGIASDTLLHPLDGSSGMSATSHGRTGYDEFDLGMSAYRPYAAGQYPSQASLASTEINSSQSDLNLAAHDKRGLHDDQRHLSPGPSILPYSTPHKKPYDADGQPRAAGPSRLATSVGRSLTLHHVSRTLRDASARVANVMGKERDEGLSRLPDDDGYYDDSSDDLKKDGSMEMLQTAPERIRPQPMPPESAGLRGRTLGVFGPRSPVRRAMNGLMRSP